MDEVTNDSGTRHMRAVLHRMSQNQIVISLLRGIGFPALELGEERRLAKYRGPCFLSIIQCTYRVALGMSSGSFLAQLTEGSGAKPAWPLPKNVEAFVTAIARCSPIDFTIVYLIFELNSCNTGYRHARPRQKLMRYKESSKSIRWRHSDCSGIDLVVSDFERFQRDFSNNLTSNGDR